MAIVVTEHCVGLATACLAIRKHSGVKSTYKVFNHFFTDRRIDNFLSGSILKDMIINKEIILTENLLLIDDCNFAIKTIMLSIINPIRSII